MGVLEKGLLRYGRMLSCYTDKAAMFQTAIKTKRQQEREGNDREPMPDTQIGRALRELNIVWTPAHSPQAVTLFEIEESNLSRVLTPGLNGVEIEQDISDLMKAATATPKN